MMLFVLSCTTGISVMVVLCQVHVVIGEPPLTKPHCRSKCGDVNISYPFGFADDRADCYLRHFGLICNNSYNPPKVFSGDFEVLHMSLESGEIRVLFNITYMCCNSSGISDRYMWDLSLPEDIKFSYTKNVYTAVGCDTAAFIFGGGERNYTGGCLSVCGDRNNIPDGSCSVIGCCQTSIPEGLHVYSTYVGSFYNHSDILDFNNCSYSFLVEKNNYTFHRNDLTYVDKRRVFPIVWDWSISNQTCEEAENGSDFACVSKNSSCLNSMNDGGYLCNCTPGYRGNPYLQDGCQASPLTKPNCRSKCGDLNISYPFGFTIDGDDCFLPHFGLKCNETYNPPKVFSGDFEVLDMSLESAQMKVSIHISYDCYSSSGHRNWSTWDLSLFPVFQFSNTDNIYTAVGCDTAAFIFGGGERNYTGGCLSVCEDKYNIPDDSCSGIGCCQTSIPEGLRVYSTGLGSFYNHSSILDFNNLVEKKNYTFDKNDLTYMDKERMFPVVLDWSISNQTCEESENGSDFACVSKNSSCLNSMNDGGYLCNCTPGYRGNPYLQDGCQDIDECQEPSTYPCNGTCANVPGSYTCTCPDGTSGDPKTYGCTPIQNTRNKNTSNTPAVILIPVLLLSSLGAIALGVFIYAQIQRRKLTQLRHKYFLQNGGAILEQQISSSKGTEKRFRVFTMDEIEKATDKFAESRILGRGGQGIVYRGTFSGDNSTYAIKKSLTLDGSKVEEFINEMVILSQINHRNVVKLLGCCLEEENPLLVYEFVPNGTLFQHIRSRSNIPWDVRLKIGAETAGALGYLHSSVSIPIVHGDVKSSNILLGDNCTAKVSDFGASRLIPVDDTQVNTLVQGTLGFLDPEYLQTHELTDRSDVYSFGVVLLELLTGKTPLSSAKNGEPKTLATYFLSCMEEDGSISQLLDDRIPIVGGSSIRDETTEVANVAKRCLSLRGKDRPSMMEVAMELQRLRRVESHPWHPHNVQMATHELLVDPPLASSSIEIDSSMNINDEVSLLRQPKAAR